MRIPSYSSVLGFALVAGLIAAGVSLVRNLPDMRATRESQRSGSTRLQPEENPTAAMSHLARAEEIARRNPSGAERYYARWRDAVEERLSESNARYDTWYAAGWARKMNGDDEAAQEAWAKAAEAAWALAAGAGDRRGGYLYDAACNLALSGNTEDAIVVLGHAIDAGWRNRQRTVDDRDLESLHTDERFWGQVERMPKPRGRSGMLAS